MVGKCRYFLCILLFMMCPSLIKASACSNADKVKYQEMAKNINITYEYVEANEVYFNLTASNVVDGLYIRDLRYEKNYYPTTSEYVFSNRYYPGKTYKFVIYTKDANCKDEQLYIHYVNLPHYNQYHNHYLCDGIEEFKYCQKWVNNPMGFESFVTEVLKYKDSIQLDEEEQVEKNTMFYDLLNIVIDFYLEYYYIILSVIIVVCLIVIVRHNKKNSLF